MIIIEKSDKIFVKQPSEQTIRFYQQLLALHQNVNEEMDALRALIAELQLELDHLKESDYLKGGRFVRAYIQDVEPTSHDISDIWVDDK